MPLTFTAIRLGVFGILIGISGVVIGLATHYRGPTWISFVNSLSTVDSSYQDYPLAVGAISIIVLLPAYVWSRFYRCCEQWADAPRRIIIFFVRSPTTPQLWLELLATFILAMLWMAVGLRVVTLGINKFNCDSFTLGASSCVTQQHQAASFMLVYVQSTLMAVHLHPPAPKSRF
jgi:hypothetical protein